MAADPSWLHSHRSHRGYPNQEVAHLGGGVQVQVEEHEHQQVQVKVWEL